MRGWLFDVVTSNRFEVAILSVVVLNMFLMMIQHYGQSDSVTEALHILLHFQKTSGLLVLVSA